MKPISQTKPQHQGWVIEQRETEQAVMQAIEGLSKDLTLLIIAHRLTTLKNCTHIVELGDIGIKRPGSYQEIVNKSTV